MSRITGTDAANLMEAYSQVYAPQELTEDQIWEEVESWVNSLLEEGYDLSEYTWEEMYESYIEEQGRGTRTGSNPNVFRPTPSSPGSRRGAATAPSSSSAGSVTTQPGTRTGSNPNVFRPTPSSPGSRRGAAPVPSRSAAPAPVARPAAPAAPAARPAAPAARPAAPAAPAARPAAPAAPAARPAAPAPVTPKPSLPSTAGSSQTRPSLSQQSAEELRRMRKSSQQRIMSQGGTPATSLVQSFDAFDIIKGYLLDEGYADDEDSALVIMANMSEEWRDSIVEAEEKKDEKTDKTDLRGDETKKKPKGWKPTGPKRRYGERPGWHR